MPQNPLTPFGKEIKHRLVDLDKQNAWLIEEVKKRTGLYFDSSYLAKIMNGQQSSPRIINAICEILDIQKGA